jgi:hypothetical protein
MADPIKAPLGRKDEKPVPAPEPAKVCPPCENSGVHPVVVVGAGHLIGPQGLPQRLRALGYRVEGP